MSYLPPELWLEVLRWTTCTCCDWLYTTKYQPFETTGGYEMLNQSLRMKAVVVRVCRQWRALAVDMLYEDLRIRHGERTLAGVLESCKDRGRWVRRAELPYTSTVTTTADRPLPCIAILQRCPELEVLVRPAPEPFDSLRFDFLAEGLSLTSLKRLEWWNISEAARSGGINSLDHVLSCTPNLQYLLVGGNLQIGQLQPSRSLDSLTTLRLRWMNYLFIRQICRWSLPALAHIIVDNSHSSSALEILWETFGSQIQIVEFGKHLRFYIEDHLTSVLRDCPMLQELNYYIHFTAPPRPPIVHPSLRSVRLHCQANYMVSELDWQRLSHHFSLFSGPSLPSLRRIILYGEWYTAVTGDRFARIHRALAARNCVLELPDGTVIHAPAG